MDVDSRAPVLHALAFLPQLDHACGGVSVCVRVEVVPSIRFIDGDVLVRQVELDGWFGVSCGHAHTLDTLPHHGAFRLLQQHGGI